MQAFLDLLPAAETRWDAAALLLRTWRARPAATPVRRGEDPFLEAVDDVRAHFVARPGALTMTDDDRVRIADWTADGTDLAMVDAVGFGLSYSSSAGFAQCWRERLGADVFRPTEGDVYPVSPAPWPPKLGLSARAPLPQSMNVHLDDHPFVRSFRAAEAVPIEFDFTLWRPLRTIGEDLDVIAFGSPNQGLAELGLDTPDRSRSP